jgi:hypothetical protein
MAVSKINRSDHLNLPIELYFISREFVSTFSKKSFTKALFAGGLCVASGTHVSAQESSEIHLDHATSAAELMIEQYYSEDNGPVR